MKLTCIILAAGKGTRMKSKRAKVLHEICFKPILYYPIKLADNLKCQKIIVVVGHHEDKIKEKFNGFNNLSFVSQKEQLGTGHAVLCSLEKLDEADKDIIILCGDTPLLKEETITALYNTHKENKASVSILTAKTDNPENYGRIVKDTSGNLLKIVEEKDADTETKKINEINTGTYIVGKDFLDSALKKVKNKNSQGEYYLTDIISIAVGENKKVATLCTDDFFQVMGINTKEELAKACKFKQCEINKALMLSGVIMLSPESSYIEEGVKIEQDVTVYPNVMITGDTTIREGATIHNGCVINSSEIGADAVILPYSVIEKSVIESDTHIGPFARLRPETVIKTRARIGNFVEIKKSTIGENSKAGHLSYIGDATLGKNVNIGAGTITCNYDGERKYETIIEDNVFIGSNTALVAPVTIKKGALVGAGAVITKDVPEDNVAIERSPQKHYKRKKKDN